MNYLNKKCVHYKWVCDKNVTMKCRLKWLLRLMTIATCTSLRCATFPVTKSPSVNTTRDKVESDYFLINMQFLISLCKLMYQQFCAPVHQVKDFAIFHISGTPTRAIVFESYRCWGYPGCWCYPWIP